MTQTAATVAWQVAPGPGKCNTLTVERVDDGHTLLRLRIQKPGVDKTYDVTVPCASERLMAAANGMAANWHVELARTDRNGIFTATRLLWIIGTPYAVRWILTHVDVSKDGTAFTVEDTLDTLCITRDRSGALHLIAI